jgi:hypothetical protein
MVGGTTPHNTLTKALPAAAAVGVSKVSIMRYVLAPSIDHMYL